MKQNTINLTTTSATALFCKILSISLLAFSAAYAKVAPTFVGPELAKLEKVTLHGDHTKGDSAVFTYTDLNGKEMLFNKEAGLASVQKSNSLNNILLEITPVEVSDWHDESDRLVCNTWANKQCKLLVSSNQIATNLPDTCGNYTLLEAWERYYKLADDLEFSVDPVLSEAFGVAGKCFDAMQAACKAEPAPHCNM